MRTNIVLDEDLVREAQRYSKARTKRGLVDEALRMFVRVRREEERRAGYADRIQDIRLKTQRLRLRTSPSDLLREDRDRR
jgi:Arc/MetJ family transcription regulator